ncbi:hypothetical protein BU24DRAFT_317387, partial [Aaosphaeria arxii CBS 175.79]
FLLARLHTDSLQDAGSVKEVKSTLDKLLKNQGTLNKAYDEAIQRIDSQMDRQKKRAKRVLSWITYARRQLTTTELCCALAVERDEAKLDPDNVPDVEDLLSVCAGLVIVDPKSSVIHLVHQTTQEYFEGVGNAWFTDARQDVASTCLTYLSFDVFKTGSCSSDEEFKKRLQDSRFLDYAAKHWAHHAATVESDVLTLACSFLSDSQLVSSATQVYLVHADMYAMYSQFYPKDRTGFHLTAQFGLSVTLEAMLQSEGHKGATLLRERDSYGDSPLSLAAENGHVAMVKLLLRYHVHIDTQGGGLGKELWAASWTGHETIVNLLLEAGAN